VRNKIIFLAWATLFLSACGSQPTRKATAPAPAAAVENKVENKAAKVPGSGGYLPGDGPGTDIPVNLDAVPDAIPKNEPLHRYANRPYTALGKTYKPLTVVGNFKQRGIATWYGKKFNGEHTSSGEIYDMYAMTAAHPTLPLPSYARVTNLTNQKSVVVRINDRGPFMNDRIIDLSYTAAFKLGIVGDGSAEVEIESLTPNANVSVTVNTITANSVQSQPLESSPPASAVQAVSVVPATIATPAPVAAVAPVTPPAILDQLGSNNSSIYLQLGAFGSEAGAAAYMDKIRNKLGGIGKQLKLTTNGGLVRVHMGPYANVSEARDSAEDMEEKLGFKPMVNLP
jgi:rare lipoprotein A